MEDNRKPFSIYSLVALAAGILIGLYVNMGNVKKALSIAQSGNSTFDAVMSYINEEYVDSVNIKEIEENAIAAMMDELDPHSQFISEEEFNAMNDPLLGSFEGIGVSFRLEKIPLPSLIR